MPNFNDMMHGIVQGIDDFSKQLTSSSFYQDVIPGKEGFGQELAQKIGSNDAIKLDTPGVRDKIYRDIWNSTKIRLEQTTRDEDLAEDLADEIMDAFRNTDYSNQDIEKIASLLKKNNVSDKRVESFKSEAKDAVKSILNNVESEPIIPGYSDIMHEGNPFGRAGLYVQTYFGHPDAKVRQRRITAVAGTYAGVAVGGRLLSGGTLTEDNYGRRDIAGIPFI